jgi:HEAT repeat protein
VKARQVRWQRSRSILGEEAYARLEGARGREAFAAALTSVAETEQERVYLWLSLFGCHEGGWDRSSGFDSALTDLLRGASAEALRAAVKRAVADPWARAGAARWILGEQHWSVLDGTTLAETVSVLARSGLAHPRPYSRRRTLIALGKMGGEQATASLRAVVAGGVSPRPLGPDEVAESSGGISRRGEPTEIRGVDSERAIAALFLARLADKQSLPALRKLLDELQAENRVLVQRSIALLEGR